MAPDVLIAAETLAYPEGGGHLWAYLNWALGFRSLGCRVHWLEPGWAGLEDVRVARRVRELAEHGIDRVSVYAPDGTPQPGAGGPTPLQEIDGADLLVNLIYGVPDRILRAADRAALVDIDPGMTQLWFGRGELQLQPHDVHVTIGEGVASGTTPVPDLGVRWHYVPPPVDLDAWPAVPPVAGGAWTSLVHWWGAGLELPDGRWIDNDKRTAYTPYLELPRVVPAALELAVSVADLEEDGERLRAGGWALTDPVAAAGSPARYQEYVRRARGEFSCAKPAYVELRTGWISDRSVCFLASGRPVVLEDTGPCGPLDEARGEGVWRFSDLVAAGAALSAAEADRERHALLARRLAEERFDARRGTGRLLELAL